MNDRSPTFEERPQTVALDSKAVMEPAIRSLLLRGSAIAEESRRLWARVRSLGEDQPFRCIGITSSLSGEGKTTLAVALATAIAHDPARRVLLLEADLRKPTIDAALGTAKTAGLGEWLLTRDPRVPVRRLIPLGPVLLSAGRTPSPNPESLGSGRMVGLMAAAREAFDYVVVDCPPLLPVADTTLIQDLVDGFVIVVRSRKSPRAAVERAVQGLKPGRIRGVVLNDSEESQPGYYKYGGYGSYAPYR